jgi:starvation-inducible DNA-binding protein
MTYKSPSPLPEKDREQIAASLNARLADGIDLHSQVKVAHWNVKGPQFAALHPLFETFAVSLAAHNDALAERAVTLGAQVRGTARYVARASTLPEYPAEASQGLVHVRLLAERFEQLTEGLRATRRLATELGDEDTVDLVNAAVQEFEKHAWFLRASLAE